MTRKTDDVLFRTFETASLDHKKTSKPIDPRLVESVFEFMFSRARPMIIGEISLRFDVRLDMTSAVVEKLVLDGKIRQLTSAEKAESGYHPIADVYRVIEK